MYHWYGLHDRDSGNNGMSLILGISLKICTHFWKDVSSNRVGMNDISI